MPEPRRCAPGIQTAANKASTNSSIWSSPGWLLKIDGKQSVQHEHSPTLSQPRRPSLALRCAWNEADGGAPGRDQLRV